MGLLDSQKLHEYYDGNDYGKYQFTSLDDIINQFMAVYVGEGKIIPKAKRIDVAFHAQRALQELSFDTFKSTKAQEITLPPSLQMILPQDYVNYTKVSWVDSAGIKHLLYPASKTSNPPSISKNTSGDFKIIAGGSQTAGDPVLVLDAIYTGIAIGMSVAGISSSISGVQPLATVLNVSTGGGGTYTTVTMDLPATETWSNEQVYTFENSDGSPIAATTNEFKSYGWIAVNGNDYIYDLAIHGLATNISKIEVGMNVNLAGFPAGTTVVGVNPALTTQNIIGFGVTDTSFVFLSNSYTGATSINQSVLFTTPIDNNLSTTWLNYKSGTPSGNQDDYQDDTYWPLDGSRFGLDPQHAQANGSFYIDNQLGKIHFSSNISGKTVILDYISDSLGTDGEMQVHKFAEEAMYKWISHAIMAGRVNVPEHQVNRFKKERFAAIRTAKLRLSNLKLEEITQILRGKSKQIKH
jgi:hypothetical protein